MSRSSRLNGPDAAGKMLDGHISGLCRCSGESCKAPVSGKRISELGCSQSRASSTANSSATHEARVGVRLLPRTDIVAYRQTQAGEAFASNGGPFTGSRDRGLTLAAIMNFGRNQPGYGSFGQETATEYPPSHSSAEIIRRLQREYPDHGKIEIIH